MVKSKKKSNQLLYILIGVIVLLIIVAVIGKSAGWIGKPREIEVELSKAKMTTIVEKVSASGDIQPETEVKLSPDVAGEIIELNVEEGDSVRYGKLLIRIRPDNLESALERTRAMLSQQKANLENSKANLEKAKANFKRVKADYDRKEELFQKKVISASDWEIAQSGFKAAENDLKSAEQNVVASRFIVKSSEASVAEAAENLRLTNVYAPSDGIVSKLNVERGERVVGSQMMSGTELLRIADLNKMEVRVDVNENDIIRVKLGDTAVIDVDAYSHFEEKFKGVVTSIANTANDKISTDAVTEFEVKIRILNNSYEKLVREKGIKTPFRPGMTASVDIITQRKENVLSVPLSAVTTRDFNKDNKRKKSDDEENDENDEDEDKDSDEEDIREVVFINEDGKTRMIEVKTGISDFDNIEVLEGVGKENEVVSGPFLAVSKRLKDGDYIKKMKKKKRDDEDDEDD